MGKPKRTITVDYLQRKLDLGWAVQEFCEDLGVTEDFLWDFLNKNSKHKSFATCRKHLTQNEQIAKKKRRNEERKANSPVLMEEDTIEEVENTCAVVQDNNSAVQDSATPISISPPAIVEEIDPTDIEIEALTAKLNNEGNKLADKVSLREKLIAESESLKQKIENATNYINKLEVDLQEEKHVLSSLKGRFTVNTNHLTSVDKEILLITESQMNLKAKIKELQKISVFVCENGEITFGKKVKLPDSWQKLYQKLLTDSLVENITVKQVQQLAKLIVLYEMFEKEGTYFEFIFENDTSDDKDCVKTLFELLTEKSS